MLRRTPLAASLVAALLSFPLPGCGGGDADSAPGAAAPAVRDSAGVEIVSSDLPAWEEHDAWTVSAEADAILEGTGDPDFALFQAVDVALLPVGGTYTMNAAQAAEACQAIGARTAVPYHWGDIVGTEADAQAFVDATAGCDARLIRPGEVISV